MKITEKNIVKAEIPLNRIEALTDGIFAIAMTLLVLGIDLPEKNQSLSGLALHEVLLKQINQFLTFVLSFIILASFWIMGHQQNVHFKRTDKLHLWINILILLFVCLVPYSSSLVNDFSSDWMANLFFNSNMFTVALLYRVNWIYAIKNNRLVDKDADSSEFITGSRISMAFLIISVLAVVLSVIIPYYSSLPYLLLIVILNRKRFSGKIKKTRVI